jgi:hypothetical protein
MKFDARDVHIILIGYHGNVFQYRINLDILRFNYSFGDQLYITTMYNGDPDKIPTGIGENNFIATEAGRGPVGGVIDAFNEGGEFALLGYRPIVIIMNYDMLFFTQDGFVKAISDFMDSGKQFSAAIDGNGLPAPDIMMFRKEYLAKFLPMPTECCKYREQLEIAERYKDTELGFENIEEYVWYHLVDNNEIDLDNDIGVPVRDARGTAEHLDRYYRERFQETVWHLMDRTDLPRLRWSENLTLGHMHEHEEIKAKLIEHNVNKGYIIESFLRG